MKIHKNIPYLLLAILFCLFFSFGYYLTGRYYVKTKSEDVLATKTNVLNEIVYITITPTNTPAPLPTITTVPTVKPVPTITVVPQNKITPEDIHRLMERFAGQYGIDVNILRHVAVCESGFNPNANNGKYVGLYQFDEYTWKKTRDLMGEDVNPVLRLNAEESIQTASYLISLGKSHLWPNCYP